ncbi:MAG: BLUF domain-containing protein [Bacteroidota bacterium]
MTSYLIYASLRTSSCTDEEIERILDAANRNNPGLDVTGVLLYTETKFIQYLEGPKDQILGLFERIKTDPRHRNPVLISFSSTKQRLFPTWAMVGRCATKKLDFKTLLSPQDERLYERILQGLEPDTDYRVLRLLQKLFSSKEEVLEAKMPR